MRSADSGLNDILLLLNANLVRLDRQIIILQQERLPRVEFFKEVSFFNFHQPPVQNIR